VGQSPSHSPTSSTFPTLQRRLPPAGPGPRLQPTHLPTTAFPIYSPTKQNPPPPKWSPKNFPGLRPATPPPSKTSPPPPNTSQPTVSPRPSSGARASYERAKAAKASARHGRRGAGFVDEDAGPEPQSQAKTLRRSRSRSRNSRPRKKAQAMEAKAAEKKKQRTAARKAHKGEKTRFAQ
jgi:hypothetical protein